MKRNRKGRDSNASAIQALLLVGAIAAFTSFFGIVARGQSEPGEIPICLGENVNITPSNMTTFHPPITINGNAELVAFPNKTGNGTSGNPYVIENLTIDAGGVGSCIEINNTSIPLVISNCTVSNSSAQGWPNPDAGIKLYNCSNVTIIGCNSFNHPYFGIFLHYSSRNTLMGNFLNSNIGIGINLDHSSNNLLMDNLATNNDHGIGIIFSNNNTVSNNTASFNPSGISVATAHDNTFSGNVASNNSLGFALQESDGNTFHGNNISFNSVDGFSVDDSINNTIYGNLITSNSRYGIKKYSYFDGDNNTFYLNMIRDNGVAEAYSYSIGSNWDNGSAGNYWGDYVARYPNATNNGSVWSEPYAINGPTTEVDNFPLIAPWMVEPVAAFSLAPPLPVAGEPVQFTDASLDPDGVIVSWSWDFGDNTSNSTLQDPVHAYASSGNYTVMLTVTDDDNNTAHASQLVAVEADLVPSANFTCNATKIVAGQAVQFSSTGTGGNAPLSCSWDFGDNSTNSSLQDPAHQYASAGIYTVSLTVTDRNGNSSTETKAGFIEVLEDYQPTANFTANETSILEGDHVQFTYTGTAGNGNLSYQWDFGDGTPNATSQDPVHQYTTPGNYTVAVTVVDVDGDSSTCVHPTTIEVFPDLFPVINFTSSATTIVEREWINFTFIGSEGNAPASFQWDVGDGTSNYTAPAFSHQYVDTGTYTVTLTVMDDDGDANTTSIIDYIVVDKRPPTNGTVQHFENGSHDVYLVDDVGTIWLELPGLVVLSPVDVTLTLYLDINGELEGTYGVAAGFFIEFNNDGNVVLPALALFHAWNSYFTTTPDPSNLSLYVAELESLSLVNTNAAAVQHPGRCTFTLPVNGSGYFGIISSNEERIEFSQDVSDITGYMPLVVMLALGLALGTVVLQSRRKKKFSSLRGSRDRR
ncbi:MAG: PKD domain-containing protein [Candidatus Hodarchaeota archaeon]